jgi:hypothetical protein
MTTPVPAKGGDTLILSSQTADTILLSHFHGSKMPLV